MTDVADSVYSAHDMRWFSALDIERAYYQLPIAEESRDVTAFSTQRSHYQIRCIRMRSTITLAFHPFMFNTKTM